MAERVVIWKARNLRVRVLGEIKGRLHEDRLLVCKETAQPGQGVFSIRCDEAGPA